MGILNKIISSLGVICLFGCSSANDEQERLELLKWINHQLTQIDQQLAADIETEKKGFYPHQGKAGYASTGSIEYTLKDKHGKRLELSQHNLLTLADIKNTDGFRQLETTAGQLKLQLTLNEIVMDGDDVESEMELDEYIDDVQRYFVLRVAGW